MVKVIGAEARQNTLGEKFIVLILMGGMEMVKSKETGRFYATARKCSVSSTFDEETAKSFIGTRMPGAIEKVKCEPYDFVVDGGEVLRLDYRWGYNPSPNTTEEVVMGDYAFA
jgi:hypothetical protein